MRRSVPWAAVAVFPLAALALVTAFEPEASPRFARLATSSGAGAFLLRYWWSFLFAAIAAQFVWFLVAAARNRALPIWQRVAWSVAMVLFGPLAAPAYWWLHSERGRSVHGGA